MMSSHRPLMHFIGCLIRLRPLTYRPNIDILVTGYKPVRLMACRIRFPAQGILTWLHIQRFLHPISVQCIRFAACYTIIITLICWVIHVLCRSQKTQACFRPEPSSLTVDTAQKLFVQLPLHRNFLNPRKDPMPSHSLLWLRKKGK